jgi:hypothetical protein
MTAKSITIEDFLPGGTQESESDSHPEWNRFLDEARYALKKTNAEGSFFNEAY